MKRYVSGLAIMLMLFSGAPTLAEETDDYFLLAVPKIAGTWKGTWTSDWYDSGNLKMTIKQEGTKVSGTLRITNTDCGTVTTDIKGSITDNMVNIKASWECFDHLEVLKFTKGKITNNNTKIKGKYHVYVSGDVYDQGNFSLNK